jgi:hypothetical protein
MQGRLDHFSPGCKNGKGMENSRKRVYAAAMRAESGFVFKIKEMP